MGERPGHQQVAEPFNEDQAGRQIRSKNSTARGASQPFAIFGPFVAGQPVTSKNDVDAWQASILANPMVTAGAKVTAASLKARFNFTTFQLNPSVSRMAADTAQKRRSIEKQCDQLRFLQYLDKRGTGGRTSNSYRLLLTPAHWRELEQIDPVRWAGVNPVPTAGVELGHPEPREHQLPPARHSTPAPGRDELLRTPENITARQPRGPSGASSGQYWGDALPILIKAHGQQRFEAYFAGVELDRGPPVVLVTPTPGRANLISDRYRSALNQVFGENWTVIDLATRKKAAA